MITQVATGGPAFQPGEIYVMPPPVDVMINNGPNNGAALDPTPNFTQAEHQMPANELLPCHYYLASTLPARSSGPVGGDVGILARLELDRDASAVVSAPTVLRVSQIFTNAERGLSLYGTAGETPLPAEMRILVSRPNFSSLSLFQDAASAAGLGDFAYDPLPLMGPFAATLEVDLDVAI